MIPEKIVFREKDLDNYLTKTKRLLVSKNNIKTNLDQLKKDLKNIEKEIKALNNWLINNGSVKI